jgi:hypothetical protein
VKAWKTGHKEKCDTLAAKLKIHVDSVKIVEQVHETGRYQGIKVSEQFDYALIESILEHPIFHHTQSYQQTIMGPSMTIFYTHLKRVATGQWWFFKETDTLAVYREKIKKQAPTPRSELDYFFVLALLMCGGLVDESLARQGAAQFGGLTMPAARFMEIYTHAGKSLDDDKDRARMRRQNRVNAMKIFRNKHHK